jgi:hypothetical protein
MRILPANIDVNDSERLEEIVERRDKGFQETQEHPIHGERLASPGQLAGAVRHELRNSSRAISDAQSTFTMILPARKAAS